ncbi:MAG: hypothetical protein Q4C01_05295 [Clostridia bacterium]|nr:hypothetical protein [Clostridia bacterium]
MTGRKKTAKPGLVAPSKLKWLAIALLGVAAILCTVQFFTLHAYLKTQTDFYTGTGYSLQRLFPLLLCAALSIAACALVKIRKASRIFSVLSFLAALVQFFMIKITDVHPYFVTYAEGLLWALYVSLALLLAGGVLNFKSE